MNVVFLTLIRFSDIEERGIYQDLMRKFRAEGHKVYIVSPNERRLGLETSLVEDKGVHMLNVRTLNVQKTNVLEKGLGTVLLERQYKATIRKYLSGISFDLILYSTPPITFTKVIAFLKKRSPQARTYLLLKDIFPQNALDLSMLEKTGIKGLIYRFFRKKEKKLYALSDYIGCMSPANVEYVLSHNPGIDPACIEVAPNSISLTLDPSAGRAGKVDVRRKNGLPVDVPVFIYGGNLGRPQGISYLIDCLDANADRTDCFFVVIGSGTEFPRIKAWKDERRPSSVKVMEGLPKAEYDELVRACDVGLIFLDHRFTIPNYPSRLLSYLENKMPVICATDSHTDIGRIAEKNGYGFWCESVRVEDFVALVDKMIASDRKAMGERGYDYLKANYLVENTYGTIMKHF